MKRLAFLLAVVSVLLSGCALLNRHSNRPNQTSSSTSSVESRTNQRIISKVLVGKIDGIEHRDTITYQGKKLLRLRMELISELPQEITDVAATMSPNELTKLIREAMQEDPDFVEAQRLDGFSADYSVTADKKLQVVIDLDLQKINVDKVEDLSYFEDFGISDIKDATPEMFILGMKLGGLKEE